MTVTQHIDLPLSVRVAVRVAAKPVDSGTSGESNGVWLPEARHDYSST